MILQNWMKISEPHDRPKAMPNPEGFTLVEILVVLVIIGLMGGMVLAAVQGVTTTARAARTRSIIASCDSVIQEQYESYKYRAFPVEIPITATTNSSGVTVALEVLATEAARVRLIMLRDLQRMEMPDKALDVAAFTPPSTEDTAISTSSTVQPAVMITAVANQVASSASGRVARDHSVRVQRPIDWERSRKTDSYYSRYVASGKTWTPEHEGAECLYMIMATSFSNGTPALDAIPSPNIADTDGDGMPEILDGWGTPLAFIRWPAGFDDGDQINKTIPDDFDPFQVDFGQIIPAIDRPWSMRPLIVSAGEDQEFGMVLSASLDDIEYNLQKLPKSSMSGAEGKVSDEGLGRSDPYFFPDPFLRPEISPTLTAGNRPGAITDSEVSIDNISNYSLQDAE
ncbi:type II secretion system protein [Aporhodopirellula aestuarii]|uniref:Type II secretion system GspH family protein n=1 Tax=Aporhodopirellula aestuarii TaxID=2950107 RepID=A0ABT0U4Z9_9BACT|nr:type II secretion system protein [Aporhodopirellula aestuarii]MCM2371754.1 type II secretion system GspH family protein [Aporhodopirellula aestuarii]